MGASVVGIQGHQGECSNAEMRQCAVRRAGFQECPRGNWGTGKCWYPQGCQQLDRYSEKSDLGP